MAWTFLLNQKPTSGGHALWMLKEFLVGQGWSVARSGDGTGGNFSAGGDTHAPGGPYAGSLDLVDAWFELRQPVAATPRRSFLFQNFDAAARTWETWYSSNGTGFTGGAPSATARGTAADEEGIMNTPAGTTVWLPPTGSYRLDFLAGDTADGFSFFFGARDAQVGYASVLSLDVCSDTHASDADPAIVGTHWVGTARFAGSVSGALYSATAPSQTSPVSMGWYRKGLAGAAFVVFPHVFWGAQEGALDTLIPLNDDRQSQAPSGAFQDLQIFYWRGSSVYATELGFKGKSRLYRTCQPRLGIMRPTIGRTRMGLGAVSIPWDGSTLPIF